MRLLICATEFPPGPGGIGTQAFQVASHLVDLGWEVSVACVQDYASDAEIEEFNRSQRFRIERLPSPSSAIFKAAARSYALRNAIRDAKPDIILATGDRAILLAGTIASLYRHDWAAIEHGRVPGWRIERVAKKIVLNRANSVVCVSAYTRERTVEEGVQ
jgi:phosphatidyl-myo-inositol dimannoside synthase